MAAGAFERETNTLQFYTARPVAVAGFLSTKRPVKIGVTVPQTGASRAQQ
ncbi:hypothetical protein AWB82_04694 [Caballeronia glebae]|uniref:Uncharacterized protein n=1 Tax=Caballeronia glebae TaxID=1777143 RepID=A0A158BXC8_9BURK|nr:hypothetical protein AWB82_04694 [Caballeronia glebae]